MSDLESVAAAQGPGDGQISVMLRLVRGVRNGPSPDWLQRRLHSVGLRPINALVDITNFMTFDRGRPLHVFDAAKVKGGLTVRRAREGEELSARTRDRVTLAIAHHFTLRTSSGPLSVPFKALIGILIGELQTT